MGSEWEENTEGGRRGRYHGVGAEVGALADARGPGPSCS